MSHNNIPWNCPLRQMTKQYVKSKKINPARLPLKSSQASETGQHTVAVDQAMATSRGHSERSGRFAINEKAKAPRSSPAPPSNCVGPSPSYGPAVKSFAPLR
jgi:hypothetical protein